MAATCGHGDGPCPMPPHPKLMSEAKAAGARHAEGLRRYMDLRALSLPTGHIAGLNDGLLMTRQGTGANAKLAPAPQRAPLRGEIRVFVVLMDFSDAQMPAGSQQRFQDLFFSVGKLPGKSATEFYAEVSNGMVSLAGQVVGPYRAPRTLAAYAGGNNGFGAQPNIQTLANDALQSVKDKVNFDSYDNDGNGYVDAFIVVHAGRGAEQTGKKGDIWSCKWNLPTTVKVNNVQVSGFLTVPEDALLGVCCHELGHLLFSFIDLYDVDYSSAGIGNWCLMSGGSWGGDVPGTRPCEPSAYCKLNQGWVTATDIDANRQVSLSDVKTGFAVLRFTNKAPGSKEYFLIENRQMQSFDASLPGAGLLIWHVDDAIDSNANENRPKVALMQADGLNRLKSRDGVSDDADPFPGSKSNTEFTSTSTPNNKFYDGSDSGFSITRIGNGTLNGKPTINMGVTIKGVSTQTRPKNLLLSARAGRSHRHWPGALLGSRL